MINSSFIQPRNQHDIVQQRLNRDISGHFQYKTAPSRPIGLKQILNNAEVNEEYLAIVIHNALRSLPVTQKIEFIFMEFDPEELTADKRTIKELVSRSKAELAEGVSHLICSDPAIVYVSVDVDGIILTKRLIKGSRLDAIEEAKPYFNISYLIQT